MPVPKPSTPKGTRDFLPAETLRREYIFNTCKKVFTSAGYVPIETPAMELLSTLTGKYGQEGDKLLFKILNSGDFLSKLNEKQVVTDYGKLSYLICEKGLRYDLTVPFARFVVQHRNDINFPFKRYQIQPVWRGDRPAKGRYREFYQCDVDVIGSRSLLNEIELITIIDNIFKKLDINVVIKLNNRKILAGIAEVIGDPAKFSDLTIAMDKLEKIGIEKVLDELTEKGFVTGQIKALEPFLATTGSFEEKILFLEENLHSSETGLLGVKEVSTIFEYLKELKLDASLELDLTLARGLNYYTGAIFEVEAKDVDIGSICGGGRYDDLTGIFGLDDVSGVGVSFGADRIYDVLLQLDKFPKNKIVEKSILFVNFGEKEAKYCLPLVSKLREKGFNAELYPDAAKLKKQLSHADARGIQFVVLVGDQEMKENKLSVKNLTTGDQKNISLEEMIAYLLWVK